MKRIIKQCLWCSKDFSLLPSRSFRKFCSQECSCKGQVRNEEGLRKGHGWNIGKRYTKEEKEKMNLSGLKLGQGWNKGISHTEEQKEKFRQAKLESPTRYWLGKPRKDMRGENNWKWKGGIGTERHQAMGRVEYKLWRTAVFMRDDYTCQTCGERGGKLEADHIKPWALYPELRYAINNGRTLCKACHRQTDTWGLKIYGSK